MKKEEQNTIQFKNIIKELGLSDLSIKKQDELLEEMAEIVYKRILLRIVKRFSEEKIAELNNLLDKKDFDEVNKHINNKIPNFMEIFKQEIETFQEEMTETKQE